MSNCLCNPKVMVHLISNRFRKLPVQLNFNIFDRQQFATRKKLGNEKEKGPLQLNNKYHGFQLSKKLSVDGKKF